MIDGLKLTLTGDELRRLLAARAATHRGRAEHWRHEIKRTEQTEDMPLLPEHMCEHEAEFHQWRAEVLEFLGDHLEPQETYRLAQKDLGFGEQIGRAHV